MGFGIDSVYERLKVEYRPILRYTLPRVRSYELTYEEAGIPEELGLSYDPPSQIYSDYEQALSRCKDIRARLEQELASIPGFEDYKEDVLSEEPEAAQRAREWEAGQAGLDGSLAAEIYRDVRFLEQDLGLLEKFMGYGLLPVLDADLRGYPASEAGRKAVDELYDKLVDSLVVLNRKQAEYTDQATRLAPGDSDSPALVSLIAQYHEVCRMADRVNCQVQTFRELSSVCRDLVRGAGDYLTWLDDALVPYSVQHPGLEAVSEAKVLLTYQLSHLTEKAEQQRLSLPRPQSREKLYRELSALAFARVHAGSALAYEMVGLHLPDDDFAMGVLTEAVLDLEERYRQAQLELAKSIRGSLEALRGRLLTLSHKQKLRSAWGAIQKSTKST